MVVLRLLLLLFGETSALLPYQIDIELLKLVATLFELFLKHFHFNQTRIAQLLVMCPFVLFLLQWPIVP